MELAERHGLLGLMHRGAAPGRMPAAQARRCAAAYREQAATALLARCQVQEITRACTAHGIPLLVLKGGAALLDLYPDAGSRRLLDLDFLIPRAAVGEVRAVMADLGYAPLPNRTSELEEEALARLTHLRPFRRPGRLPVEMHVSVLQGCVGRGVDGLLHRDLWARAVPIPGQPGLSRCADTDFALHTLIHYARDLEEGFASLKALADLALLAGRGDAGFWPRLWDGAREWRVERSIAPVLAAWSEYAGLHVGGGPAVPAVARDRVLHGGEPREGAAAKRYLALLSAAGEVPGVRARLRYLVGLVFPSQEKLRHRYGIPEGRVSASHSVDRAWRVGRSVLRSLRRRKSR